MKIYKKVIIDIFTGETIFEDFFDYEGAIAHCGGGGHTSVDKEYNRRMATIAETQSEQAVELYNFYKYGTFTAPESAGAGSTAGDSLFKLEKFPATALTPDLYKNPETGAWMTQDDAKVFVSDNPQYQGETTAAIVGTGQNGQVTLQDILKQNPSYANMELAQVAANMGLIEPQTKLAQGQIDAALQLLPGQTALTQAQNDALMTLLGPQTDLSLAKIDAAKKVLGPQADLIVAQAQAAQELLPGQTALTKARNESALKMVPEKEKAGLAMVANAMQNTEASAANRASAEVSQQFKNQQDMLSDAINRSGSLAGSARAGALTEDLNTERTKSIAGARTAARTKAKEDQFSKLSRVFQNL